MRVIELAIALIIGGTVPAFSQVCTSPHKGLRVTDKIVQAQTVPFSERGQSFALDIYSSYAPQIPVLGAPWCLLYEAESASSSPIGLFNWPLGGMQMDKLDPHDRQSRWITRTSVNTPSVNDTVMFVFKSTALRSRAYQAFRPEEQSKLAYIDGDNGPILKTSADIPSPSQRLVQLERSQYYVKEPVKFLPIGGDFSGSNTTFRVGSAGEFDGKIYRFVVSIASSGEPVKDIRAPYISALNESQSPEAIITQLRSPEINTRTIPEGQRQYSAVGNIPAEQMPSGYIYIIDQPITFTRENGRVCFTVPTYSPVPIPAEVLSCNLGR
jgi:hypothetical protein